MQTQSLFDRRQQQNACHQVSKDNCLESTFHRHKRFPLTRKKHTSLEFNANNVVCISFFTYLSVFVPIMGKPMLTEGILVAKMGRSRKMNSSVPVANLGSPAACIPRRLRSITYLNGSSDPSSLPPMTVEFVTIVKDEVKRCSRWYRLCWATAGGRDGGPTRFSVTKTG